MQITLQKKAKTLILFWWDHSLIEKVSLHLGLENVRGRSIKQSLLHAVRYAKLHPLAERGKMA